MKKINFILLILISFSLLVGCGESVMKYFSSIKSELILINSKLDDRPTTNIDSMAKSNLIYVRYFYKPKNLQDFLNKIEKNALLIDYIKKDIKNKDMSGNEIKLLYMCHKIVPHRHLEVFTDKQEIVFKIAVYSNNDFNNCPPKDIK